MTLKAILTRDCEMINISGLFVKQPPRIALTSKHCIVGLMLARCSCQHLSNSAQRCSQCWGDAVLHQSPAFSQHWYSVAGRHRNLRRANNGVMMFPTSARSWKTAASQHRTANCREQHRILHRANNGGIMWPTLAKS